MCHLSREPSDVPRNKNKFKKYGDKIIIIIIFREYACNDRFILFLFERFKPDAEHINKETER